MRFLILFVAMLAQTCLTSPAPPAEDGSFYMLSMTLSLYSSLINDNFQFLSTF